ncbi:CDF family Co(II)/Ni(II) efflux transporter DmeF [Marichromatium bheemlicum]|uniref:CDF family Co(II)/Ni(II) efflux transporter DmeF n=1 Tax=Marichromatium bheemlicum TaxID=365339 RepID=A0ABX1I3N5_9GAMM|nr:CDF family Co(II)/Ni(II) efflux transporter DmeF [Marichromatium bheemlicum]NKN32124.1 CDF family Co(II)/Ni(II) efflux transporter DmeF [Marichromatium bheemlicum]
MHVHTLERWQHSHDFAVHNDRGERNTYYVLALTAVTMVVEIGAGTVYGSMALLADGWHMGTHVAAFLIAILAYRYAARHAHDPAHSFGTGKINVLGGFASAIALGTVALMMLIESLQRLIDPQTIHFNESILVALLGLGVNLASALLLKDAHHHHGHAHHHGPDAHHHDHDHNLRAAYVHVIADALTSLLAIAALLAGKLLGWHWLDPVMGMVGAAIITVWAYGLLRETTPILVDTSIEPRYREAMRAAIEADADNRVADMHVWRVGANHYAAIISLVTHEPRPVEHYKQLLADFDRIAHLTVEVNACAGPSCLTPS